MKLKFEPRRLIGSTLDTLIILNLFFVVLYVFNLIFPETVVRFAFMNEMSTKSLHWFFIKAAFLPVFSAIYSVVLMRSKFKGPFGLWVIGFQMRPREGVGPVPLFVRSTLVIFSRWALILFVAPVFVGVVRIFDWSVLEPYASQLSIAILGLCVVVWLLSHLSYSETTETYFWDRLSGFKISQRGNSGL